MLFGRRRECEVLDRLLVAARGGHGEAIVMHGEPGVGKTALLEYAIAAAQGFQVLRTVGNEAERELPFAALQQLCAPGLASLEGSVALIDDGLGQGRPMRLRRVQVPPSRSGFAGFRFPPDVIVLAVRWYLRYGLSYRDVEELLAERGITVDHVTVYRWVQRFTLLLIDAARPCRHVPGDRWFVDETYLKVAGRWVYLYRAIDQFGQVIDVLASPKRDLAATRRFFTRALEHGPSPTEVVTDKAAVYPPVLEEIALGAWHNTERYTNNRIESDHGRLKFRLRPMRGLKQLRCAQVISAGHAFVQNVRHGHYELGVEETVNLRVLAAFDELALAI